MVVPSIANGFRSAVRALRSLDGGGCEFPHIHVQGGPLCCAPGEEPRQGTALSGVREELESLDIHVQPHMQLRSGRRDQDPIKDRPLTPLVSVARGSEMSKVRSITELCGLRVSVESYVAPKGLLRCKRFGHTQRNCGY